MEDIDRLKVVLAEKKGTNGWLAAELGKNPATVSKWCTNTKQTLIPKEVLQKALVEFVEFIGNNR